MKAFRPASEYKENRNNKLINTKTLAILFGTTLKKDIILVNTWNLQKEVKKLFAVLATSTLVNTSPEVF